MYFRLLLIPRGFKIAGKASGGEFIYKNIQMNIQVVYNKSKVIQALRYHFLNRPEIKTLLIIVNIFAIFSAYLIYIKRISPLAFIIASSLWFVLMLTFWFWLPRTIYKRSSTFREEIGIDFRDSGMFLQTSRGVAEWAYNRFQYFIESPHFFHLYINDKSFFIIPKDACIAEADTIRMRDFFTEKIGRKKK